MQLFRRLRKWALPVPPELENEAAAHGIVGPPITRRGNLGRPFGGGRTAKMVTAPRPSQRTVPKVRTNVVATSEERWSSVLAARETGAFSSRDASRDALVDFMTAVLQAELDADDRC